MYEILKPLQQQAIINAKKLWKKSETNIVNSNNEVDKLMKLHNINPSTTVYQLIETIQSMV